MPASVRPPSFGIIRCRCTVEGCTYAWASATALHCAPYRSHRNRREPSCAIDGCDVRARHLDLGERHYRTKLRPGDALLLKRKGRPPDPDAMTTSSPP